MMLESLDTAQSLPSLHSTLQNCRVRHTSTPLNFLREIDEITLHTIACFNLIDPLEPHKMSADVVEAIDAKLEEMPELTEAEKKEVLEQAIQKRAKLAESRLEMVKLFLQNGKQDIAVRRLRELMENFAGTSEAATAQELLSKL